MRFRKLLSLALVVDLTAGIARADGGAVPQRQEGLHFLFASQAMSPRAVEFTLGAEAINGTKGPEIAKETAQAAPEGQRYQAPPEILERVALFLRERIPHRLFIDREVTGFVKDPLSAVEHRYQDLNLAMDAAALSQFLNQLVSLTHQQYPAAAVETLVEDLMDPVRLEARQQASYERRLLRRLLKSLFIKFEIIGFDKTIDLKALKKHPLLELDRLRQSGRLQFDPARLDDFFFKEFGMLLTGRPLVLPKAPPIDPSTVEPITVEERPRTASTSPAPEQAPRDRVLPITTFPNGVREGMIVLWGDKPKSRVPRKILKLQKHPDRRHFIVVIGVSDQGGISAPQFLSVRDLHQTIEGLTLDQAERTMSRVAGEYPPLWQRQAEEPAMDDAWREILDAVHECLPAWNALHREPRSMTSHDLWRMLPKGVRRDYIKNDGAIGTVMMILYDSYGFPLQRVGASWRAEGLALTPEFSMANWSRVAGRRWQTATRPTFKEMAARSRAVLYGYSQQFGDRLPTLVDQLQNVTGLDAQALEDLLQEWETTPLHWPAYQTDVRRIEQVASVLGITPERLSGFSADELDALPDKPAEETPEPLNGIPAPQTDAAIPPPPLAQEVSSVSTKPLLERLLGEERFPLANSPESLTLREIIEELSPAFAALRQKDRAIGAPELLHSIDVQNVRFVTSVRELKVRIEEVLEEAKAPLQHASIGWRAVGLARHKNFLFGQWPGDVQDQLIAIGRGTDLRLVARRARLYLQAYHLSLGKGLEAAVDESRIHELSARPLADLLDVWQSLDRPAENRREARQIESLSDLLGIDANALADDSLEEMMRRLPEPPLPVEPESEPAADDLSVPVTPEADLIHEPTIEWTRETLWARVRLTLRERMSVISIPADIAEDLVQDIISEGWASRQKAMRSAPTPEKILEILDPLISDKIGFDLDARTTMANLERMFFKEESVAASLIFIPAAQVPLDNASQRIDKVLFHIASDDPIGAAMISLSVSRRGAMSGIADQFGFTIAEAIAHLTRSKELMDRLIAWSGAPRMSDVPELWQDRLDLFGLHFHPMSYARKSLRNRSRKSA